MTKEELEKEAYEEAEKIKECQTEPNNEYEKGFNNGEVRGYKDGYYDGAEPREKRIEELEQKLETERSCRIELVNKIAELEAQIERMKCCSNCMWSDCDGKLGNPPCKYCDFNSKWELRR